MQVLFATRDYRVLRTADPHYRCLNRVMDEEVCGLGERYFVLPHTCSQQRIANSEKPLYPALFYPVIQV